MRNLDQGQDRGLDRDPDVRDPGIGWDQDQEIDRGRHHKIKGEVGPYPKTEKRKNLGL